MITNCLLKWDIVFECSIVVTEAEQFSLAYPRKVIGLQHYGT